MAGNKHMDEVAAVPRERHHDEAAMPKRDDEGLAFANQLVGQFFAEDSPLTRQPYESDVLRRDPRQRGSGCIACEDSFKHAD